jgi:hypothetical protein
MVGVGMGAGPLRLRVAGLNRFRYIGSEHRSLSMHRHPISVRPTAAQLAWLKAQRTQRGLALNALVILALEQAMAADPVTQAAEPEQG